MSGVRPNRFDHEVEFVCTVDLARYAVSHIGLGRQSFGEVMEPLNTLRVEVLQQKHRARRVLRPRKEIQMVGAEVEHGGNRKGRAGSPPPIGSAVEGFWPRARRHGELIHGQDDRCVCVEGQDSSAWGISQCGA